MDPEFVWLQEVAGLYQKRILLMPFETPDGVCLRRRAAVAESEPIPARRGTVISSTYRTGHQRQRSFAD